MEEKAWVDEEEWTREIDAYKRFRDIQGSIDELRPLAARLQKYAEVFHLVAADMESTTQSPALLQRRRTHLGDMAGITLELHGEQVRKEPYSPFARSILIFAGSRLSWAQTAKGRREDARALEEVFAQLSELVMRMENVTKAITDSRAGDGGRARDVALFFLLDWMHRREVPASEVARQLVARGILPEIDADNDEAEQDPALVWQKRLKPSLSKFRKRYTALQ